MLVVPGAVWRETLEIFRTCGKARNECVAYWVGPAGNEGIISRVVHPIHTATPFHYRVDPRWVSSLWLDLMRMSERVRVQVHTHKEDAFHSHTDDEGALVYQRGFLSLVVPGFAMDDSCRDAVFMAELEENGSWRAVDVLDRVQWG